MSRRRKKRRRRKRPEVVVDEGGEGVLEVEGVLAGQTQEALRPADNVNNFNPFTSTHSLQCINFNPFTSITQFSSN